MSLRVLTWVLEHSDEKLARRLVLIALADFAHDDGSKAFPSVDTLARHARLSRRSVQDALKGMVADGSLVKTGATRSGTNIYTIAMGADAARADVARVQDGASRGARSAPDPSEGPVIEPTTTTGARQLAINGGGALIVDPNPKSPTEVGGVTVTLAEVVAARAALARFNEVFGKSFLSKEWMEKIIRRLRERPDLGQDGLIDAINRAAAGKKWWKDDPTPSIVFGNSRAYERALNTEPEKTDDDAFKAYR